MSDEKYEQETVFEPFVPIAPEYQEEDESPTITVGEKKEKHDDNRDKDKLTGQEKKPQPKG